MLWQSPVSSALLYVWRTSSYSITYVTTRTILVSAGFQLRRIGREAKCLQLFGGYGYMAEYPISRFWTDARVLRIYGGTSEIMKELVARSLLGR